MKIIQNIASLKKNNGGTTFFINDLSQALAKLGQEIYLVSEVDEKFNLIEDLYIPSKDDVKTVLIKKKSTLFNIFFDKIYLNEINKQFESASIVHVTGIWTPFTHRIIYLAKKKKIPIIISPQGMLEPWALKNHFLKKKIAWHLYQKNDLHSANVLHATAETEAENLRKLGFKQPIAIIPNCINFKKLRCENENVNNDLETKNNKKTRTLLFLSRIHPKKGLTQLIEAWDQVRPVGWKVLIAGPDEDGHRGKLELLIKKKKLTQYFDFVGPVDGKKKSKLYRSADIFILPTFSENFGIVIAEALSFGLPVITTKAAPWEIIEKLKCGWWVDPGTESISKILKKALIYSPEKLTKMGIIGKIYAENTFDSMMVAEQMLEVYRWMLSDIKKPNFII